MKSKINLDFCYIVFAVLRPNMVEMPKFGVFAHFCTLIFVIKTLQYAHLCTLKRIKVHLNAPQKHGFCTHF